MWLSCRLNLSKARGVVPLNIRTDFLLKNPAPLFELYYPLKRNS